MGITLDGQPEAHPLETGDASHEQLEDVLTLAFYTQAKVSTLLHEIAESLYRARALWIGGNCLPWDQLTPLQKCGYLEEVEALVKNEPISEQWIQDYQARHGQKES